jgi:hypothetical protein
MTILISNRLGDIVMDRKLGLSAALAALVLAAGIESVAALETACAGVYADQQRIEATVSVADLRSELELLRATDPNSPLICLLLSRIIALADIPMDLQSIATQRVLAPY